MRATEVTRLNGHPRLEKLEDSRRVYTEPGEPGMTSEGKRDVIVTNLDREVKGKLLLYDVSLNVEPEKSPS